MRTAAAALIIAAAALLAACDPNPSRTEAAARVASSIKGINLKMPDGRRAFLPDYGLQQCQIPEVLAVVPHAAGGSVVTLRGELGADRVGMCWWDDGLAYYVVTEGGGKHVLMKSETPASWLTTL